MDIFWERQEGNLCRKHSINAFFGCAKINTSKFFEYCNEYNKYIFDKYNIKIDISSRDYVLSNDIGIVPFILKKFKNIYCFHLPINQIKESISVMNLKTFKNITDTSNFIFVYNHDHIWGLKKINNKWKKIDSLSGVSDENNILSIENDKNIGLIIPRELKKIGLRIMNSLLILLKYLLRKITKIQIIYKKLENVL